MSNKDYDLLNNPVPIADQNWERNISPLVTIGCITYKHEKYIRDSIEGFLIQKTTFPVEIIIHDDASPDKTPEIISEYEQKYPNLFFTIFQDENQFSIGNTPIFGNFIYPKSRGKYIAFCEGDDYWSDPLKLQKQVDFLEENPDYSLCSHETFYTYI
ncbi:MAG TPA: glycosyltransferase, partial [Atribacterota bacterium]|nr:glycosyltransferase [Atribacterota bacterium]